MRGAGTSTGTAPRHPVAALRRLAERTPLRVKLITALLALVALALVVISFISTAVFRGYLLNQADTQLNGLVVSAQHDLSAATTPGALDHMPHAFVPSGYVAELLTSSGTPVVGFGNGQNLSTPGPEVPSSSSWMSAHTGKAVTVPAVSGNDNWRVIVQSVPNVLINNQATGQTQPETVTLVVGQNLGTLGTDIGYLTGLDVIVGIVIMLGLGVVSVAVVRANLRPLDDIEETAQEIAAGHLNRRVPDRDPRTEVGRLGRSINTMLTQIEAAFHSREESEEAAVASEERMRRFIADASHELRTPLTAIRGFAEYYRQRGGVAIPQTAPADAAAGQAEGSQGPARDGLSPEDLDRIMRRVEGEAARMGVLVEDLLLLARLDQQRPIERRPVDLLVLAADAVQDTRMIAPGRPVNLTVEPGGAFLILGDELRLRQVIGNLMSNALTHTPDGTPIDVRLGSGLVHGASGDPGRPAPSVPAVVLDVADHGEGLTPEQAERVFERFYRADQARNRKSGGSGLGLAIVSALVAAHGGTASVQSSPGQGATFRITLPLAPDAGGLEDEPEAGPDGPEAGVAGLPPGTYGS
ncbi:MAG TPA: HAMP domain-containing sensor histidine kinase [Streptosporangiaceae bacterium]